MESNQQKVDRLTAYLAELQTQAGSEGLVNSTAIELDEARKELEQEQAAQVRIQDATEQAAYFMDNLVIEGLTMRELSGGEDQYQMLRIAVQNKIINLAEDCSKQISEIQAEENAQQSRLKQQLEALQAKFDEDTKQVYADQETIKQLQSQLTQSQAETADYISKLKNATDEIDRLNSHVDDLRKEIAVGARNAYKVIDSEEQTKQLKELADKIKASRVTVYDVVPDRDFNPTSYTAKRADNGEVITYNWTQKGNYVVLTDPNEVEQFRAQHASNQENNADPALDQPVQDSVTPEVTFPTIPQAEAPSVGEIEVVDTASANDGQGGKSVEERLSALEARVFGAVSQVA